MNRYVLLIALALTLILAHSALADCYEIQVVYMQYTEWWDGSVTWSIQHVEYYGFCEETAGGGGGGGGGNGGSTPQPIAPYVGNLSVDTTNVNNPTIAADITHRDPYNPLTVVQLDVDGTTVEFVNFQGDARYQFSFAPIPVFGEGSHTLTIKGCVTTGDCGQSAATMWRSTPSPATDHKTINASWREEECDEQCYPVTRQASYEHDLRQMYMTTRFSVAENGENSRYQIKQSLVTIAGHDPMPVWTAGMAVDGTVGGSEVWYSLSNDSPNPNFWWCSNGYICQTKAGSAAGLIGYSPNVHEGIWSFVIDGWNASFSGGSLDVWSFF